MFISVVWQKQANHPWRWSRKKSLCFLHVYNPVGSPAFWVSTPQRMVHSHCRQWRCENEKRRTYVQQLLWLNWEWCHKNLLFLK